MAQARGKRASTGNKLVIVESPAKAKTIGGYLGAGYTVEASIGHIRDLPRNAADVPAAYKGQPWARLGVNTDADFEPLYVISPDRKQQVSKLKALVKDADEVYLATDEDREGEAIAWHLAQTLKPTVPVRRMVFHEITPAAIARAVSEPRDIDAYAGGRPGDPADPGPALRLRGLPGAVEEGAAEAVGRPGAVGGDPDRGRAGAAADGLPHRQLLGHRGHLRAGRPQAQRPGRPSGPPWSPSATSGSPPAGTSTRPPDVPPRRCCTWTRPARAAWPPGWPTPSSRSPGSRRSRTGAGRTRRS